MRKLLFPAILLILLIISCSKEEGMKDQLQGRWRWESSFPVVNPLYQSATIRPGPGEDYLLTFLANHTFTYTLNNTVLEKGAYITGRRGNEWTVKKSTSEATYFFKVTNDTLTLVSNIPGGGMEQYSRAN